MQLLCDLQVAERKHKPTVLEFMEPLIDQTVPGTVEEEYMVSCFEHALVFCRHKCCLCMHHGILRQADLRLCVAVSHACVCHPQLKHNPVYRWKCLRIVARQHISVRARQDAMHCFIPFCLP